MNRTSSTLRVTFFLLGLHSAFWLLYALLFALRLAVSLATAGLLLKARAWYLAGRGSA